MRNSKFSPASSKYSAKTHKLPATSKISVRNSGFGAIGAIKKNPAMTIRTLRNGKKVRHFDGLMMWESTAKQLHLAYIKKREDDGYYPAPLNDAQDYTTDEDVVTRLKEMMTASIPYEICKKLGLKDISPEEYQRIISPESSVKSSVEDKLLGVAL